MEMQVSAISYPYTSANSGAIKDIIVLATAQHIYAAGFDKNEKLVQVEMASRDEHVSEHIALLRSHQKVKALFFLAEEYMTVPAAIYKEQDARKWMSQLFPCDAAAVKTFYSSKDSLHLLYAIPDLVNDSNSVIKSGATIPVQQCQLNKGSKENGLQITLIEDKASYFLYQEGKLFSYQTFDWLIAEDIAWKLLSVFSEHQVDKNELTVTITGAHEHTALVREELSAWFPGISGTDDGWKPVKKFFQMLYACA